MKLTVLNLPWWWTNPLQSRSLLLGCTFSRALPLLEAPLILCFGDLSTSLHHLKVIVPTSPNCLPFKVFLIWGKSYNVLRIFSSTSAHWAYQRLQTGSASSVVLSAAMGWSWLTHISCPSLSLKFPCMRQNKFFVPLRLPAWLVFDLLSPNRALLLSQIYRWVPVFKAAVPLKNLRTAHSLLLKGNFNHFISFSSCFFEFCTKFYTCAWFHTVGHQKYNAWNEHCCLLAMIASDWMAAVRSCW